MTRTRYLIASLAAPVAALLSPVILALAVFHEPAVELVDGRADDGANRGAGLFLLLVAPWLYVLGCAFYAALPVLLDKRGRLTRRWLLSAAMVAPWTLALPAAAWVASRNSDWTAVALVPGLAVPASLCLAIGAWAWWVVAVGLVGTTSAGDPDRSSRSAAATSEVEHTIGT